MLLDGEMPRVGHEGAMFEMRVGWREVHKRLQAIARKRAELDAEEAALLIRAR